MIVIVFGLPGSGKSYFAGRFADTIKADYISSDRLRKKIFPKRAYSENEKLSVYTKMLTQVKKHIGQNKNLVFDATFYRNDIRKQFIDEAGEGNNIAFIEIHSAEPLIRKRLQQTRTDSDADFGVYQKIKAAWEPLHENHLILESTDNNICNMLNKAAAYLRQNNDKRANH